VRRPEVSEYPERYGRYIDLVPEEDICSAMSRQVETTVASVSRIPDSKLDWRYAADKWTTREVFGHILDTERIFGFRLLAFARGDTISLSRADENLYVRNAEFGRYSLREWLDEFVDVRRSHVALVRHLPADGWARIGAVSAGPISVRAMAYMMVGHERHHLRIIQDKYLAP
jgi:hypothetical protein